MELQELEDLIRKYNAGLTSPEEETLLESWYDQVDGKSHTFGDPAIRNRIKLRLESLLNTYINQHHSASALLKKPKRSVHFRNSWAENCILLKDWLYGSKGHSDTLASERKLQQVRPGYEPKKSLTLKKAILRYAVAASIIAVMVIGEIKWFSKPEKNKEDNRVESTLITNKKAKRIQVSGTIENRTNDVMMASLSDSSQVTMYPGSVLNYLPEFEKDQRKLYLHGKALFKVSKDKARPFTVYAGGIATTALGTLFMVSELAGRNVSVALMEGSIKVWPENSERNDFVLLQPGDKLVVNSKKFNSYTLERKVKENTHKVREGITAATANETNAMIFKNDRLKEVFKKISEKFEITINYETVPGIEKELFTGKFLENDSLEFIFKTICDLHGYQYRKDENILTISKQ